MPTNSIVFSFTNEAARRMFELAKNTTHKRSVFCATQVFEPSVASANYSLKLLLNSDFKEALATQRTVLDMLNSNNTFGLSGNGADGSVSIPTQAQPYALIGEDITNGFVQSVAEFFEVHYAHMRPEQPCPFSFTGILTITGILTVLRKPNPTIDSDIRKSLSVLSARIAEESAYLTVDSNNITSFKVGNAEQIQLLARAAGSRGLKLTEFAIGVNDSISPIIDYKINSQLNEGVAGVHIAIGDGSSGYHIDFLSPTVVVIPLHQ